MTAQTKRLAAGGALAVVFLALVIHWLPGRQVRLHQKNFQVAVENRDWKRVGGFIAPDYRDAWNPDRTALLAQLPAAFQDFLSCGILGDEGTLGRQGTSIVLSTRLRVVGSGGPIAQFVMGQVSALTEPFTFTWQRQSWKPWDWQLVSAEQPELAGFAPPEGGVIP